MEENSFTEAAEKNFVSQSAISQAMNALETELGVKLIERKNRSFSITTAGEYFYRKCKVLLHDLDDIKDETIRLGSSKEKSLHMIAKDEAVLREILDDSFVLVHMTGMRNYFSAVHENMPVEINGDTAVLTGQTYVSAAVFGGGRSNWHLQQKCSLKKIGNH